jgi:hypothetical protein
LPAAFPVFKTDGREVFYFEIHRHIPFAHHLFMRCRRLLPWHPDPSFEIGSSLFLNPLKIYYSGGSTMPYKCNVTVIGKTCFPK